MKITVIYSSARHGSTRHCTEEFLNAIKSHGSADVKSFILPKDMPNFCRGCFSCIMKGESSCPDLDYISRITASMEEADIIILSSPVYGLDVSGQMKALLDHLCFMWASHRPNPKMFNKVGIIFSTTAGMGLNHTVKTMKNSFNFWGVKRIFVFKKAVAAMKWEDVSEKKKAQINKKTEKLAEKSAAVTRKIDKMPHRMFFNIILRMMRGMMRKNTWNPTDRNHWESLGWLDGRNPFK